MLLGRACILQTAYSYHPYSLLHDTQYIYAHDKKISVQQQHAVRKGRPGLCYQGVAVWKYTYGGKNAIGIVLTFEYLKRNAEVNNELHLFR
jgi:hypothetical protein